VKADTIELWTAQAPAVLDALERDGLSYVKKEYILKKYGASAWIFLTAYDFFVKEASRLLPRPPEAESPVWLYRDPRWAMQGAGTALLRLAVPRDQVLLFDLRDWNRILNLSLLGSEQEREQFEKRLREKGIGAPSDVFATPFYPMEKQQIRKSWEKLLRAPLPEDGYVQAAAWMLRSEWILPRQASGNGG